MIRPHHGPARSTWLRVGLLAAAGAAVLVVALGPTPAGALRPAAVARQTEPGQDESPPTSEPQLLVPGTPPPTVSPGITGATTPPTTEAEADDGTVFGLDPDTVIYVVIGGLLLVAVVLTFITWRYVKATRPVPRSLQHLDHVGRGGGRRARRRRRSRAVPALERLEQLDTYVAERPAGVPAVASSAEPAGNGAHPVPQSDVPPSPAQPVT